MPLKPVVFIPGFPASELRQTSRRRTIFPPGLADLLDREKKKELVRLLVGPDNPPGDIVAGEPIRGVIEVAKQAQSLYDILRQHFGYTVQGGNDLAPVGWDWRLGDPPPVLELFQQVLADKTPEPFVCAAADGDQAIDRRSDVTLRLTAADENGNPLPNAKASFPGFPGARAVSFGNSPRKEIVLRRGDLRGNAAPDLFRFVVNVTWGEAGAEKRRELPVLIRV